MQVPKPEPFNAPKQSSSELSVRVLSFFKFKMNMWTSLEQLCTFKVPFTPLNTGRNFRASFVCLNVGRNLRASFIRVNAGRL